MSLVSNAEHRDPPGITRRSLTRGAAWSVPAAVIAVAAPALAVSARCVAELDQASPDFSTQRNGAEEFIYLWSNPYDDGSQVRLRVNSAKESGPGSISTANNLLWSPSLGTGRTYGAVAGATRALRFSVDTLSSYTVSTLVTYTFTLEYRAAASPDFTVLDGADVPELSFAVTDIEGQRSLYGDHSAERGWLDGTGWATAPTDPSYLLGSGTAANPWRANTVGATGENLVDNWAGAGTVTVQATAPISTWTYTYALDTSGSNSPSNINSNAWFAAPRFTVNQPGCG